jgi:predicted ribosome quality control (RQC) complex YloA/Tae2 family protein
MVKQRYTTADLAAEVGTLRQQLHGMRVTNVYDVTSKLFAFKLARGGDTGEKAILLVESGQRMHTVDEMPDKPDTPSNFVLKLRKHVKARRLEDVRQLGSDRVGIWDSTDALSHTTPVGPGPHAPTFTRPHSHRAARSSARCAS